MHYYVQEVHNCFGRTASRAVTTEKIQVFTASNNSSMGLGTAEVHKLSSLESIVSVTLTWQLSGTWEGRSHWPQVSTWAPHSPSENGKRVQAEAAAQEALPATQQPNKEFSPNLLPDHELNSDGKNGCRKILITTDMHCMFHRDIKNTFTKALMKYIVQYNHCLVAGWEMRTHAHTYTLAQKGSVCKQCSTS